MHLLDAGALLLETKGHESETMKISVKFGAAVLAFASVATSCATVAGETAGGDKVYLVGVAGGG